MPDAGQLRLQFGPRRHVVRADGQLFAVELFQGSPIHFAVGGQRQSIQDDKPRGKHVVGQLLSQPGSQRGRRQRALPARHDECSQTFFAVVTILSHHGGGLHIGVGLQSRFDFAEFDAKTADLDLLVPSPQELNRSVG